MSEGQNARAGAWLRAARERRSVSVRKIAARFDVSTQAVNGWESGRYKFASDDRARVLAEVLGMDVIEVRRGLGLWVPPETGEEMSLDPLPGEDQWEYTDRLYREWMRVRQADSEADRVREQAIRGALDRDAG